MVNYEHKDLCMFVDGIGHVTLATFVEKIDDNRIRVKNPMWLSLVPRQDEKGNVRIALETPAWAFRDFFADHNDDQLWDIKVDNYSWYEGKSFSDMLKLHYYNSFSRIENGVQKRLDKDGNEIKEPVPPPRPQPPQPPQTTQETTPELKPQA